MRESNCCSRCFAKSKLLMVAGGIEWWRCTVPACGYLFSAWVLRPSVTRRDDVLAAVSAAVHGEAAYQGIHDSVATGGSSL